MELLMIDERDDWARGKAEKSKKNSFSVVIVLLCFPWGFLREKRFWSELRN